MKKILLAILITLFWVSSAYSGIGRIAMPPQGETSNTFITYSIG